MQEAEIISRIENLCRSRSWTYYRLAKESNIPYSTLCTMLHKSNAPSIPTLTKICAGFGITLSEFFDKENSQIFLSKEENDHLITWKQLSEKNKIALSAYMDFLLYTQARE